MSVLNEAIKVKRPSRPDGEAETMSARITKAFAIYQATITPEAIKSALASSSRGGLVNAASIRAGALLTLHAAIEKELAR